MMETASSSVPCNSNTMNTATMVQNGNAGGGDSDSAVSSMGSERVPSLSSDTEWMETNSDSGHNDGYPSHSLQEYGYVLHQVIVLQMTMIYTFAILSDFVFYNKYLHIIQLVTESVN